MSLMVTSGGGYRFWWEIGYCLVAIPVGHRVFAQASYRGTERGQGLTDGRMIVDRTVIRR